MKIIEKSIEKHKYHCQECKSIIEIADDEFKVIKEHKPFPYLMGLKDFQKDTRVKSVVCECPVCGATIIKEVSKL